MNRSSVLLVTKGLDLGGLERVLADLAVGLRAAGHPTTVALINDARRRLVPRLVAADVTIRALGGTDRIGFRGAVGLWRAVRDPRYDLIHVHSPLPAVLVRLCRPTATALVCTLHTTWGGLHPLTRLGWRLTARRDDRTIVVSGAVASSLPHSLGGRVTVIPHGIDPLAIASARIAGSRMRSELGIPADMPLIVTVASHRDVKNYPNLLRAVARVRAAGCPAHLVSVGDGDRLADNRRIAGELGISDAITFLPSRDDVLSVIAAADVIAVASDYEGQPLVVVEALALGRPVVATAVGRVPELVPPAVGRVVPPNEVVPLADALLELFADPALRLEMSEAAMNRTPAWTVDDVLEAHETLYAQIDGQR